MADLSPEALDRFVEAVLPKVLEVTGLQGEAAEVAAVSLVPPFEEDEAGNLVLRGEDDHVVGRIPAGELDPYEVLEGLG